MQLVDPRILFARGHTAPQLLPFVLHSSAVPLVFRRWLQSDRWAIIIVTIVAVDVATSTFRSGSGKLSDFHDGRSCHLLHFKFHFHQPSSEVPSISKMF